MDWGMVWTIIGVNIALCALLGTFVMWSFNKLDNDIKLLRNEMNDIRKDVGRISTEVAVITATLRFNGFDLDRHKAQGEI